MALEGNLKDFGLPDILQMIYFQRKTGLLLLDGKTDNVRLSFFEGKIVAASSRRKSETNRLGQLLVSRGVIAEETLRNLVEVKGTPPDRLAKHVYREGIAEADVVQPVVEELMSETVVHLFGWKEGHYEFSPQDVVADVDFPIALDTEHLLMEGLRVVDEWSLLEGKLDHQTVYAAAGKVPDTLTANQERVMALVDGNSDVSEVIERSGLDDLEAGQALVDLAEQGVIAEVEIREVLQEEKKGEEHRVSRLVLVVMGIGASWIAAILLLLSLSIFGYIDFFRFVRVGAGVSNARLAVNMFHQRTGRYPADLNEAGFMGTDPWGREYQYVPEKNHFWVRSFGSDGQPDTKDDVY